MALSTDNPIWTFMGVSGASGMSVLLGFVPKKNESNTHTKSETTQESETESYTKGITKSISKTLINKHAEAAVKKLDTYVKRFETAKATGAWNVRCMLFVEHPNPAASWQLKSILSGEDSMLEPIRIHDVSPIVKNRGTAKAPHIIVKYKNGPLFHHPFGDDFSQLQTLLTTRELSALVYFPLHSVPGLSVGDSAPEFRLTPQDILSSSNVLEMG